MSPQLFVLAIDTLGRLFRRAVKRGVLHQLHLRHAIPTISLHVDGVILSCHPSTKEIKAVNCMLQLFDRAFGMCDNYAKRAVTLLCCESDQAAQGIADLGCLMVSMPQLTIRKPLPTAAQMHPMDDKIAAKLPTWKAWTEQVG